MSLDSRELQVDCGERTFHAEATLSRSVLGRKTYHTLILRNVNDRLEAEKKIQSLTLEKEYLREEIQDLIHYGEIIGRSKPIQQVIRDIAQVATTEATVLILGETGTGKELVARAIQNASLRKDEPLVRVNCGAIPPNLIESEFFGHVKGAFTGATQKREGRFALADGGTLFLDEVGELPLDLQVKLLRVLQDGEFEPVGSSTTKKVDIRLIAATNRDLLKRVKEGEFREDLFYRLNVFPIHLPPLRERTEDIPISPNPLPKPLLAEWARLWNRSMRRPFLGCSPIPGRKCSRLENVIEHAMITSTGGRLNLDRALPREERDWPHGISNNSGERVMTVREMVEFERENLLRALKRSNWKVSGQQGAAQLLGMKPTTLSSRLKALEIPRPES